MGGEINVAYQGTFGDLAAGGDAGLFDMNEFNFGSLTNDTGAAEGFPTLDFTAINSGNATGTTVSPKDIFNNSSIPPSTSFTNLTTPGSTTLETPYDDYETSPLFNNDLQADGKESNWFSLFPDVDNSTALTGGAPLIRNESGSSVNKVLVHAGGEGIQRQRSSTGASPALALASPAVKPATPVIGAGAAAAASRKRAAKDLPPIWADENDQVGLKRARNTAAARKSRAKKVQEREELEGRISELEQKNVEVEERYAVLQRQYAALAARFERAHGSSMSVKEDEDSD
ncbi:hypothetical protein BAUCODRAFT_194898 [Baudoinia panamericana UAMH 10762]|uniref:BZIP domain-containing protein n=1 Tax=Baudoinia panamericana (strain UAMH 10762) TaxID=717646 RepID=M2NA44_BAUPA|nr:uncharacterized protein BAUCODRAFT_194898 [Baudoinia panamericana UAMH 10762]EMD01089.1 hypothetical protein BAUCODRAFT_194898 [Baudoinia panamericana UAMH 10762]